MSSLDSLHPSESTPSSSVPNESMLLRAQQIADDLLIPQAQITDGADIVPKSHIDALGEAGILGLSGPKEYGGQSAPGSVTRRVFEILAGACGVTHFVQAQHHGPVGMIAATENATLRERYLRDMCEGRLLAGVAFSHLRRPGPPAVAATPSRSGYTIRGTAPWVTSWGLAGLFVIAALLPDDRILYFCHEGRAVPGFIPSSPLKLAVMNASATVQLTFDDLFIPQDDVVRIVPAADWRERDKIGTAHANPAVFGITETCLRHLHETVENRPDALLSEMITALSQELTDCRETAYGMVDSKPNPDEIPELLRVKAWSLDMVARAAHALIAAVGGRAMGADHPTQRLMREAMFYTIQAQTSAVREATLRQLMASSISR